MTVKDIIAATEKQRPGCSVSISEYLEHINRIEADIYANIISKHEVPPEYNICTADTDILNVPDIYVQLYIFYILAQIDLGNGDITRYSNNMILYNNLLSEYKDHYTREHMPTQKAKVRWR